MFLCSAPFKENVRFLVPHAGVSEPGQEVRVQVGEGRNLRPVAVVAHASVDEYRPVARPQHPGLDGLAVGAGLRVPMMKRQIAGPALGRSVWEHLVNGIERAQQFDHPLDFDAAYVQHVRLLSHTSPI